MSNVYYSPEQFNLKIVDTIDFADGYDFHLVVVWIDKNDNLYWSSDSGCSCPTPFEDHTLESLERLTKRNWYSFVNSVMNITNNSHADVDSFLRTVRSYLWKTEFTQINQLKLPLDN